MENLFKKFYTVGGLETVFWGKATIPIPSPSPADLTLFLVILCSYGCQQLCNHVEKGELSLTWHWPLPPDKKTGRHCRCPKFLWMWTWDWDWHEKKMPQRFLPLFWHRQAVCYSREVESTFIFSNIFKNTWRTLWLRLENIFLLFVKVECT